MNSFTYLILCSEHDVQGPMFVSGYEAAGHFRRNPTYLAAATTSDSTRTLNLADVKALVDVSAHCSQYISWKCQASTIRHFADDSMWMTYWLNRYNHIPLPCFSVCLNIVLHSGSVKWINFGKTMSHLFQCS